MYITDYFRRIDQVISGCPAIISKEILFDERTKYIGFIRGTLVFRDGSELYFKEFIDTEARITKYKYGVTIQPLRHQGTKIDGFVKSRKTPSPSMGEGWGEGE